MLIGTLNLDGAWDDNCTTPDWNWDVGIGTFIRPVQMAAERDLQHRAQTLFEQCSSVGFGLVYGSDES